MCAKVFALGAVALFVTTMLLGQGTGVSVVVLVAAVVLVLAVAVVDGISAVNARIRERE
ncbi:hypothetical protein [Saccharothrix sp. ALI-22-I]|uniref:hypothetical protein n=1 Tax=Saccharothrix sp. ALI-22-I TaxID=1933778 RepID=UPI0015C3768E|nr:hypothetical protein [Saccharothrix sp. ALI-22-I]